MSRLSFLSFFAMLAILATALGFKAPVTALRMKSTGLSMSMSSTAAPLKVGINGFGRIGRQVARILVDDPTTCLKLINSGADPKYMAYQLKYDTVHGKWNGSVEVDGSNLILNGKRIQTTQTRSPESIPWKAADVDYVCESTGAFLTAEKAAPHLTAGAKKVIFSAPAKDASQTIVMGVNQHEYTGEADFVSCASCTTNGLAPVVKALHDKFGIEEALMTTVHAMTSTQQVVDGSSKKDWRGGRAASGNIIPSSTGAAKAVSQVIPSLKGKITGMAFRVPTLDVSVVDLTARLGRDTTYEEICAEIRHRANTDMKGILGYTDEAVVSSDFISCPTSSIFDATAGIQLNPRFVKIVAWYDNEWGYSSRLVDLMKHMQEIDNKAK